MDCEHDWHVVFERSHKRVEKCSICLQNRVTKKQIKGPPENKAFHQSPEDKYGRQEVRHNDAG